MPESENSAWIPAFYFMKNINAQLWKVTQDHEGTSYITFMIPSSDLDKVIGIAKSVNTLLSLTIETNLD